jgi:hypothetical protein
MDALERLRRANPVTAPGQPSWETVAARLDAEPARSGRPRRPVPVRRSVVIALALLLLVAAAAVAAGVLLTGRSVPDPEPRPTPTSGTGTARPGGVELLPVTAPDPAGGPPWGTRLVLTTRGLACLQIGRRSGDRLGVLGRNGAFNNDGRFHPVSARAPEPADCVLPAANGQLQIATAWHKLPASALRFGCQPPGAGTPALRGGRLVRVRCPAGDERDVYAGVLGPEVRSVSYEVDGRLATQRTTGQHGAYLVALPARDDGEISFSTSGGGPDRGLASVQYRDGRRCVIASPETGGGRPCSAEAAAPPGRDDGRSLKATIRTRVTADGSLHRVDVRYRAPVAVRDARLQYLTSLELPDAPDCRDADEAAAAPGTIPLDEPGHPTTLFLPTTRDLSAGASVHAYFLVPRSCHGTARGRVALKRPRGLDAGPLEAVFAPGRDVARFSVRLP